MHHFTLRPFIVAISLILLLLPQSASSITPIKREMRGVWISTVWCLDWPTTDTGAALLGTSSSVVKRQKDQLSKIFDRMQADGFNAMFFQVRPMADALYKSSWEPVSYYLTGKRGSSLPWDPLEYAVSEAHKRGIELHAWINPLRYSSSATSTYSTAWDKEVVSRGWILKTDKGQIFNPGIAEVRDYLVGVCREIISNYDVDGLVFDDYFYTNPTPEDATAGDYDLWKSSGTSLSLPAWRRNNVNTFIQQVYDMIQDTKPYVRFGVSPAGVAKGGAKDAGVSAYSATNASDWQYSQIYSDPLAWLKAGSLDYISPQLYWPTTHKTNPFGPLTLWWSRTAAFFNRHHFASHSISDLAGSSTTEDFKEIAKQIVYSRNYTRNKAPGCVMFREAFISGPKATGLGDYLKSHLFGSSALLPDMTWKEHDDLGTVTGITKSGTKLSWDASSDNTLRYTVYAIPEDETYEDAFRTDGDGISTAYLAGISYTNSFTLPSDKASGYGYAVCILDRYGREYAPQTMGINGVNSIAAVKYSFTMQGGRHLHFNAPTRTVSLYSTSGQLLRRYDGMADIDVLAPRGIYLLRAQSEQGEIISAKIVIY